eukprot:Platyproteum_vivax@DN14757_c0_g1_i1.p1
MQQTTALHNVVEAGKVPINSRGNVNVKQIPEGAVWMKDMPNVGKIASKLGVDWAPAFTGFDLSKTGKSVPKIRGIIVPQEAEEKIRKSWEEEQERRSSIKEKLETRQAHLMWRATIKAILVRRYMEKEYGTD